jgi:hypothetical protein
MYNGIHFLRHFYNNEFAGFGQVLVSFSVSAVLLPLWPEYMGVSGYLSSWLAKLNMYYYSSLAAAVCIIKIW